MHPGGQSVSYDEGSMHHEGQPVPNEGESVHPEGQYASHEGETMSPEGQSVPHEEGSHYTPSAHEAFLKEMRGPLKELTKCVVNFQGPV